MKEVLTMNILETLSNEHGLIRSFLDNLTLAVEKLEKGERPPREFFEKGVEFARVFADRFHHFKEEHLMFVQLAQKKEGAIDAKIELLRYQHERGRNFVNEVANALEGYAEGDPIKTTVILESTAAYMSLLRHHIHVEDHVFYRMAEETLSAEELQRLQEEFDKQERQTGGKTFQKCHKLVTDMGSLLVHM
jgi:hemerythrin-like domain-containing protein